MVKEDIKNILIEVLRAVVISIITLLIGILIFSLIVKSALLSTSVIKIVNQFIKTLSIFLGAFFVFKNNRGLIKGITLGVLFTIISYIIFAIMGSHISLNGAFFLDLLFCTVIGLISGIISVNIRKKD